jgi:hypothetical protein
MSKKIPEKNVANILKYGGAANILFMFLIITPLHDLMLNISITLFWTCFGFVTGFILRSKLHLFKFFFGLSFDLLLQLILMGNKRLEFITDNAESDFINSTLLILVLEYFTKKEDFAHIKPRPKKYATKSLK